LAKAGI
jgi:DNA replication licensing factor MCM6